MARVERAVSRSNSTVRHPLQIMKTLLTIFLLLLADIPGLGQQALANKPPKTFGPVKSIRYEYRGYHFNRDKTRIEELYSNGRAVIWLSTPKGRLLSSEVFEPDGRPSGTKSVYHYDIAGRLKSIVNYLLGPLSFTETFEYPDERHVRITRVFEPRKDSVIEIHEYDQAGNITKVTVQDEEGTKTELYKYDDRQKPTEFVGVDGSGKQWIKETYEYEFDAHGNWTTQRSHAATDPRLGIAPKTTVSRTITYY